MTINQQSKIFVAGHNGMVGSAIVRNLSKKGYDRVLTASRDQLDLTQQDAVLEFLRSEQPDCVIMAAAKVGGILANSTQPADFIYQNLAIEINLIHAAFLAGIKNLLFLGSSCIYPRDCPQPIREEFLLTGPLETTNEAYAIAKIAGIKLCQAYNQQHQTSYVSVMPTNLYGPNDNFDLLSSHVVPALIRKTYEASIRGDSELSVWGTGEPRREFLHVDDLADACVFLIERQITSGIYNVGTGTDLTIRELAHHISEVSGFQGRFVFDRSKPDGTPRKVLDVSKMRDLGWTAKIGLADGIADTYHWYKKSRDA